MATFEDLLIEQSSTIGQMKRIVPNYRKLGKEKFTAIKTINRIEALRDIWKTCNALHIRLQQIANESQRKHEYFIKEEFFAAEEEYEAAKDTLTELLDRQEKKMRPVDVSQGHDSTFHGEATSSSAFQLPRIVIPVFRGDPTKWESFRDSFLALVGTHDSLTPAQKLYFLKSFLADAPALILQNIQVSDANYEGAWKLLTEEYNNPRALVHAHIHAFASIPAMKSENVLELKTLRDTVTASLSALSNLKRPVEHWDDLLVYMIVLKLSSRTRSEWSHRLGASNEYPSFQMLKDFLTERIRGLSDQIPNPSISTSFKSSTTDQRSKFKAVVHNTTIRKCPCCTGNHLLPFCPAYRRKSLDNRYQIAKQARVCFNCLKPGHFPTQCTSDKRCHYCQKPHHSFLHREVIESRESNSAQSSSVSSLQNHDSSSSRAQPAASTATVSNIAAASRSEISQTMTALHSRTSAPVSVLLATAWICLRTTEGRIVKTRALLDQGSTFSFISENLAQQLRTSRQRANLQITVFGEKSSGTAKSRTQLFLEPCNGQGPSLPMVAYIYQKITTYTANRTRYIGTWPHLKGLNFADPDPSSKDPIEVLIGADLYGTLLLGPVKKGPIGTPTAQLTTLGWIISGPTGDRQTSVNSMNPVLHCVGDPPLDNLIKRFWEIEEIPTQSFLTPEEEECEKHFVETHSRDPSGRFVVRLPFRNGTPPKIGESYNTAVKLYEKIERRFSNKAELAAEYHTFLAEYESMGHMELVRNSNLRVQPVYIPHHPVIRENSITTRLRVVFNASSITSNGTTLNDFLLPGPKLQIDIAAVLMRWRRHRYVYIADVAKMFRQIRIHPDDVDYQRIIWRPDNSSPLLIYRLLTVTYGTACAPYLALRVLLQLAKDEETRFPNAAAIIRNACYVDDVLFGANDIDSAREIRSQLNELMSRGGFQLRKWAANDPELLYGISKENHALASDHPFEKDETLKVLGLTWLPLQDAFRYEISEFPAQPPTKRSVLSLIARLFDPLGWASPVVIAAKILMQDLWLQNLDWDELIPAPLINTWENYCKQLPNLSAIRIPRWTGILENSSVLEIHGFADASNRAYAAAIYLRVLNSPDNISVILLAAKSKVAPLKTISIPRLELLAIVLLARLFEYVQRTLNYEHLPTHGWTDSTVALAWISQHPSKWKTYIANRVAEVQKMDKIKWHHIASQANPADCASRGITVEEFLHHPLWWSGPSWLKKPSVFWPKFDSRENSPRSSHQTAIQNEIRTVNVLHVAHKIAIWDLCERYSSWGKLLRVTAYLMLFFKIIKSKIQKAKDCSTNLTPADINTARDFWLKQVQLTFFEPEITAIRNNTTISRSSSLKALNPFLDDNGLLRLGGRLRHSFLSYDERFPILLPRHRISELIVDQAHLRALHGGTQLTLRIIRQNFWITGARSLVKARIRQCLSCVRETAAAATQLMGDLPSPRVNPSPPFSHCGVDYAGPLQIIPYVGRGQKSRKYYVAIFVCLATRAIHLEYVEDYSTSAFLAAFRRFVSRRGLPSDMYSDNGTNFQGADRELRQTFISLCKNRQVHDILANDGISWHYIPAASPHFGGLWEAGVKSFKYHLKRVIGTRTLSQVEFSTLLCQIEACLNSRPLSALRDDHDDFEALTPGHFLIGRPLISVPEHSLLDINENLLSRWQKVHAMYEHIWRAWASDYLYTLQQRTKWQKVTAAIKMNDLVLIKDNILPPAKWNLARVIALHPGEDGHVRVVTVRTAKTTLKRPITKICPLIPAKG